MESSSRVSINFIVAIVSSGTAVQPALLLGAPHAYTGFAPLLLIASLGPKALLTRKHAYQVLFTTPWVNGVSMRFRKKNGMDRVCTLIFPRIHV